MKNKNCYLLDDVGIKALNIEEGFLPNGALYLVLLLKEKKKKKRIAGNIYSYQWMIEMLPNAWTDFCTHEILIEDEDIYEKMFIIPTEHEKDIASHDYFFYSQKEISDRMK
jgi:hypothetical protein